MAEPGRRTASGSGVGFFIDLTGSVAVNAIRLGVALKLRDKEIPTRKGTYLLDSLETVKLNTDAMSASQ